jgi:hypothetical protein
VYVGCQKGLNQESLSILIGSFQEMIREMINHRQRPSAAKVKNDVATMCFFCLRQALRIEGVVVETSKRAHPIGNWDG